MALGKTVAELHGTLTEHERGLWVEYYRLYPFDDAHRYYRPAALVAHASTGGAGDIQGLMNWLQPDPREVGRSPADIETIRAMRGMRR